MKFILNAFKHEYIGNNHTSDSNVGYQTTKMVHETAEYVKRCLGGGQDDTIVFCGSGPTEAIKWLQEVMGIAVPSIVRETVLKCLSCETNRCFFLLGWKLLGFNFAYIRAASGQCWVLSQLAVILQELILTRSSSPSSSPVWCLCML